MCILPAVLKKLVNLRGLQALFWLY
ncbi:hypothetical protein Ahy_A09g045229 isoform C [Arachis hypogaea]|uniref:Uncharacterized protein n=1 Tax=Arachis hypogaea TaxID=3818 RepID=A0A445BLW5_ARAHY|nr:hypothetical protein Ahy_A09g045229 isoform C [Arachis hypogaea]